MNASRTLTSLIAAAAIVGSVGFAYAQTTTTPAAPMAPMQGMTSEPATATAPAPAPADSGMNSELAPKADRN